MRSMHRLPRRLRPQLRGNEYIAAASCVLPCPKPQGQQTRGRRPYEGRDIQLAAGCRLALAVGCSGRRTLRTLCRSDDAQDSLFKLLRHATQILQGAASPQPVLLQLLTRRQSGSRESQGANRQRDTPTNAVSSCLRLTHTWATNYLCPPHLSGNLTEPQDLRTNKTVHKTLGCEVLRFAGSICLSGRTL